ncbi:MAG: hypothetical protein IJX44_06575 [Bacteroidaceae bacterium]|nr:hypothetical protein [Bacteroidaceae bacterium]
MRQGTMTLESCKLAAIQGIANAESLEDVYFTMMETQAQLKKQWEEEENESPLPRYTMEELNARIDRAEANIAAGKVYTCEEVHQYLEEKLPWLK